MIRHSLDRSANFRTGIILSAFRLSALTVLLAALLIRGQAAYAAPDIANIAPDIDVGPVTPTVVANGLLMYKMQVHNDNSASEDLTRVDATIRYDPNTLALVDSKLRDKSDFVSKVGDGKATVQFGKIDSDDERSATLIFRVNPAAAPGNPILADAAYDWRTADASGTGGLMIDNVIVVSSNATATPATIVPENSLAGTILAVVATGFQADEQVVTWLNTPAGVQGLSLTGKTDDGGHITLRFDSAGLAPGYYGLVLHGLDSGHEYLLPFNIAG